jgi:hypothetical protein
MLLLAASSVVASRFNCNDTRQTREERARKQGADTDPSVSPLITLAASLKACKQLELCSHDVIMYQHE